MKMSHDFNNSIGSPSNERIEPDQGDVRISLHFLPTLENDNAHSSEQFLAHNVYTCPDGSSTILANTGKLVQRE